MQAAWELTRCGGVPGRAESKASRKGGHSTHAIAQFGGRKEAAAALMGLRAQGLRARLERADEEGSALEESTAGKQDVRVFVGNLHPKATEVCRLPTLSLHPSHAACFLPRPLHVSAHPTLLQSAIFPHSLLSPPPTLVSPHPTLNPLFPPLALLLLSRIHSLYHPTLHSTFSPPLSCRLFSSNTHSLYQTILNYCRSLPFACRLFSPTPIPCIIPYYCSLFPPHSPRLFSPTPTQAALPPLTPLVSSHTQSLYRPILRCTGLYHLGAVQDEVWDLFLECGYIDHVSLPKGIDDECKGFAHVQFSDARGAEAALKRGGMELGGRWSC